MAVLSQLSLEPGNLVLNMDLLELANGHCSRNQKRLIKSLKLFHYY